MSSMSLSQDATAEICLSPGLTTMSVLFTTESLVSGPARGGQ